MLTSSPSILQCCRFDDLSWARGGGWRMLWLYLDESGDLGFDFVNKRPSRFFTVCVVAVGNRQTNLAMKQAIRRTLRRKLNPPKKRSRMVEEVKGSGTILAVKRFAWRMVGGLDFGIYAMTLNKRRVYERLIQEKERIYNYVARQVMDRIPLEGAAGSVQLVVDRSKSQRQIADFNRYIERQLQGRLEPGVALDFVHGNSREWAGLQWADLFAWGIHRKHEHRDLAWFDVFREKVRFDGVFLP
jgi:hypothetical protein